MPPEDGQKAFRKHLWVTWKLHTYMPSPSEEEEEAMATLSDLFWRIFGPPPSNWDDTEAVELLHQKYEAEERENQRAHTVH